MLKIYFFNSMENAGFVRLSTFISVFLPESFIVRFFILHHMDNHLQLLLKLLPAATMVMHDHDRVNYNKDYSFNNAECNVHLLRDLQKTTDNPGHEWMGRLKKLIEETDLARDRLIEAGKESFEDAYILEFFRNFDRIMIQGVEENKEDYDKYYGSDERTLLLRIMDYKDNYFSWVTNFEIPFSNNLSERSLCGIKSKMKISGQFQNEESAELYSTPCMGSSSSRDKVINASPKQTGGAHAPPA